MSKNLKQESRRNRDPRDAERWNQILRGFAQARLPARLVSPSRHKRRWRRWDEESMQERMAVVADIETRQRREVFTLVPGLTGEVTVLDRDPRRRQLLLLARANGHSDRLLFGHDERHLFVAPLPDRAISTIDQAFEVLKPEAVRHAQAAGMRVRRQGEWFFVPAPNFRLLDGYPVHRKARLDPPRPRLVPGLWNPPPGTPHLAEELVRVRKWSRQTRVYVRGAIRHADHATLKLKDWHRVLPNRETDRRLGNTDAATSVQYVD
jgi:hypothetical protein